MNIEKPNNNSENRELSDDVMVQLENLGLTQEEIKGRILDIGAGEGQLARELSNVTDSYIVAVDYDQEEDMSENATAADARDLPFADNSFDKVLSHASVPNVFINMYSPEFPELSKDEIKKAIQKTFKEIIRVLKPGRSAILAPVRIAKNYESEEALTNALQEVIVETEEKAQITIDLIKEEENPENKEKYSQYRLTISKKSDS